MKKGICSITLSVLLVLFILLSLTIFILNKNIEGYQRGSKPANNAENNGISVPNARFSLNSGLNQSSKNTN